MICMYRLVDLLDSRIRYCMAFSLVHGVFNSIYSVKMVELFAWERNSYGNIAVT